MERYINFSIFAIALQDRVKSFVILAFLPVFIFWALDGFYLWQERLFRSLYDYVRELEDNQIDFSMDVSRFETKDKWIKSIFADITLLFHLPILLAIICVLILF